MGLAEALFQGTSKEFSGWFPGQYSARIHQNAQAVNDVKRPGHDGRHPARCRQSDAQKVGTGGNPEILLYDPKGVFGQVADKHQIVKVAFEKCNISGFNGGFRSAGPHGHA